MKKLTCLMIACLSALGSKAQIITDTVSTGVEYANQVWYSLVNDEQGAAPQNNWDLAFDMESPTGFSIATNSVKGVMAWKYPKTDTSGWGSIDTAGIGTWTSRWNSVKSWHFGAIGRYYDKTTVGDLDWGAYDFTTHAITGNSLFIVKLPNGAFKKLWIVSLVGSVYTFKYADLNGTNLHMVTLDKNDFNGKNLGYYSMQTNKQLDREPASAKWDLVFTTYTALTPVPHTEAAVLSNDKIMVAELNNIANVNTFTNYGAGAFADTIDVIGHDWKTVSGTVYTVKDSLLYFVQAQDKSFWKIIFRGFGGTANGNYIFTKERINPMSITNAVNETIGSMTLYPNPAANGNTTVVYSFNAGISNAVVMVQDVTGKLVYSDKLNISAGLQQYSIPLKDTRPGTYVVTIAAGGMSKLQQKLVVQ